LKPAWGVRIIQELTPDVAHMDLYGAFIRVTDIGVVAVLLTPDGADKLCAGQNRPGAA
jgi:hypothetical protein